MRVHIPRSEVLAFIESLGIEPEVVRDGVQSVDIGPDAVTVTQFRRDDEGRLFAAGNSIATVTTEIAITDGTP